MSADPVFRYTRMLPETTHVNHEHHERIRKLKWWLRWLPRRAVLHRHPIIGRFAHLIRDRAYLWSFRKRDVRSAYYLGSVLSFLPVMGIQLPLALILSLLFRTNFMLLGGLQFITNPLTAAPIYYGTHQVGKAVIALVYPAAAVVAHPELRPEETTALGTSLTEELIEPIATADPATPPGWKKRLRQTMGALVVGGTITGLALGAVLHGLDDFFRRKAEQHRKTHPRHRPARSHRQRPDRPA